MTLIPQILNLTSHFSTKHATYFYLTQKKQIQTIALNTFSVLSMPHNAGSATVLQICKAFQPERQVSKVSLHDNKILLAAVTYRRREIILFIEMRLK